VHDSVGIKKRPYHVGKIKPALCKASLAFGFIPLEIKLGAGKRVASPFSAGFGFIPLEIKLGAGKRVASPFSAGSGRGEKGSVPFSQEEEKRVASPFLF
jgi:hypothetical protein